MHPNDYLAIIRENLRADRHGWRLKTASNPDQDYEDAKIQRSLEVLGEESLFDQLQERGHDIAIDAGGEEGFNAVGDALAASLLEDIAICTQERYSETLKKTALGLLPTGYFDAYCSSTTLSGKPLDGHYIAINQGLYFCLTFMARAMVSEHMQGDLAAYKTDGTYAYNRSIALYLNPGVEQLEGMVWNVGDGKTSGEVNAYLSLVSTTVLQFIALHEFAHIVHGDVDVMGLYKRHFNKAAERQEIPENEQSAAWEAEYAADEFALLAMISRSPKPINAWANFNTIYLFFLFLRDLSRKDPEVVCNYHPPAMDRAVRLLDIMEREVGQREEHAATIEWLNEATKRWFQASETTERKATK